MTAAGNAFDVFDLVRRWAGAEQRGDVNLLDGLVAADFVGVGPLGFVLTRDQRLGRFQHGLENRAFAVGVQVQETSFQGRDNSGRFRVTLVAVRQADRWLLASVHIGPLQSPPAPPSP